MNVLDQLQAVIANSILHGLPQCACISLRLFDDGSGSIHIVNYPGVHEGNQVNSFGSLEEAEELLARLCEGLENEEATD